MRYSVQACLLACLLGLTLPILGQGAKYNIRIAKLKYNGGGDWYANPTSLPNLIAYVNSHSTMRIFPQEETVEPGSPDIFQYAYVYMTGHGNVEFSPQEVTNLRTYLLAGGFLHIDDNYGLNEHIRREMKKVFPELEFIELPFSHPIYSSAFTFPNGLPKIHEHDGKPSQGFGLIQDGRLLCFYSYESDLGDGWEDPDVHQDPPEVREQALRMGTNILVYLFSR